ncbi:ATP-dependent helicase [Fischerella thermalis]|uniref:DNA 3'-5' helicase n=1 Tax=Fischerella thermalis CCMEE 5318 TaxID=2019666 RepID=A0A2N6L5E8_9CYAN|nr:ATP-dependent helicase [Fischerella thermalis]PMB16966.1 hypothetical protein CEN46_24545 [Fischerella thermalis CCMEE 5318]
MNVKLSDEQVAIIEHPLNYHARVMSVAGSGKTSTMVKRIRYLVEKQGIPPGSIQVLMFNRLARKQFADRLEAEGVQYRGAIHVNTFHSYAYSIYNILIQQGIMPPRDFWVGDREELHKKRIRLAVYEVQRNTNDQTLNPDDAEQAISLWKASMIPPERAGHRFNPLYAAVYSVYERMRLEANGATYDDMIIDIVNILQNNKSVRERLIPNIAFLLVDEYQDVNYVQQRLIELISARKCDIMVVGDDDQTIYEWRGARPEYIRKFHRIFNDRQCKDYTLTRSFRFGPIIAQCAHNVIHNNKERHPKRVVSHHISADGHVKIMTIFDETSSSSLDEFVTLIVSKVKETQNPQKVIILGRTWAQLMNVQGALLRHKVPHYLIGQIPFTQLYETERMLDYLTLCRHFQDTINENLIVALQAVLNFPRRYIPKVLIDDVPRLVKGASVNQAITSLMNHVQRSSQRNLLEDMYNTIEYINRQIYADKAISAYESIERLSESFGLIEYFRSFYGGGEASESRIVWLRAIADLAKQSQLDVPSFIDYVKYLDPQCGLEQSECIPITTIFRTKGLEYDYVFIPDCIDGFMPVRGGNVNPCYDKEGIVEEPEISAWEESERRLFYVGITRARKGVYISTVKGQHPTHSPRSTSSTVFPSPYIAEMNCEATTAIMSALQSIAAEQTSDSKELIKHYDKYGDIPLITQTLTDYYLPELGLEGIADDLRRKIGTIRSNSLKQKQSVKTHENWWDRFP